jgi:hypothetical protein
MACWKQGIWLAAGLILAGTAAPAQGRSPKKYHATNEHAVVVTRDVLGRHGYDVVRVEDVGNDRVIWYRRGNMGKGKGKGPLVKMIIRRIPAEDRIVFVDVPSPLLVDIDLRLRVP